MGYKPVSPQSDRMEDCYISQSTVVWDENQTFEAFVAASSLYAKFDCPVARQNLSLLDTAYDCETGFIPPVITISKKTTKT